MKNKTLFFLTLPLLSGMLLFAFYFLFVLESEKNVQPYLSFNHVRGMAVYHGALYTLNFDQQNQAIALFNQALPIEQVPSQMQQKSNRDEIIVYQFENKPDLLIIPLGYQDNYFLFSAPQWGGTGFFRELNAGTFKQLLAQTDDAKISSYSKSHSH